ncbi:MAG: Sensor protein [Ilumatobacteraceae bacterium]|nr:Sensor protein [Ilumatobacteraceae bacterium]
MSLRVRLLAAVLFAALIALVIVDIATYTLVTRAQLDQVDADLERSHPPIERAASEPAARAEQAIRDVAPASYVEVRDARGTVTVAVALRRAGSPALQPAADDLEPKPGPGDDEAVFGTIRIRGSDEALRVRVSRQSNGGVLVIGQPLDHVEQTRKRMIAVLVGGTLAALAAAAVIGAWFVRLGLAPLSAMERATADITESDLDRRVPGEAPQTEVGRLAGTINTMLERLDGAFRQREELVDELRVSEARMRRFVGDASHELRTPLAATAAYAELFERGARNHPEDLERAMTGIRSETARMAQLVDDLLLLAELDEHRPTSMAEVDLVDIAVEAVHAARTVAPDRHITVRVDDVVVVNGDSGRLRQVLDNLLANVRTHTPERTACQVELRREGSQAVLTVTDEGPGVAPADLTSMTERFFRADASRARSSGGAGLGLSIVAAIVDAHGGTIVIDSPPGAGLRVVVRIPTVGAESGQAPAGEGP